VNSKAEVIEKIQNDIFQPHQDFGRSKNIDEKVVGQNELIPIGTSAKKWCRHQF
jgi:hypothetical protein